MAGIGTPHVRYTLYIRKRDGILRLVNAATGQPVQVRAFWLADYSSGAGVHITPAKAKGIFVFEDEMIRVEEFPGVAVEEAADGKTAELVASAPESSLVA